MKLLLTKIIFEIERIVKKNNFVIVICIFISVSLLLQIKNENDRKTAVNFSISLPQDWKQIQKDSISSFIAGRHVQTDYFDNLYKLKESVSAFNYPYMATRVNIFERTPYEKLKILTTASIAKVGQGSLSNFNNSFILEESTDRIWQKTEITADSLPVTRVTVFIPLRKGFLNIYFFTRSNEFGKHEPALFKILSSVKIEAPDRYRVNFWDIDNLKNKVLPAFWTLLAVMMFYFNNRQVADKKKE